jgi:hypothetical protein
MPARHDKTHQQDIRARGLDVPGALHLQELVRHERAEIVLHAEANRFAEFVNDRTTLDAS